MNPYLGFTNGDCKASFAHYQAVLGAKCVFISTWAESPMADQAPGGDGSRIMQATLQFPDGSILMGGGLPAGVRHATGWFLAVGAGARRGGGRGAVCRALAKAGR